MWGQFHWVVVCKKEEEKNRFLEMENLRSTLIFLYLVWIMHPTNKLGALSKRDQDTYLCLLYWI